MNVAGVLGMTNEGDAELTRGVVGKGDAKKLVGVEAKVMQKARMSDDKGDVKKSVGTVAKERKMAVWER